MKTLKSLGTAFVKGDFATKLSFIIMGFGCAAKRQIGKGLIFLSVQLLYIYYLLSFGLGYLMDIGTLGTNTQTKVFDEIQQIYRYTTGDNSMLILLYSVLTIFITIFLITVYVKNILSAYDAQQLVEQGKKPKTFVQDIQSLFDENFHTTLLTLPTLGLMAFNVLPLVFMILLAFTNFDKLHQPPGNLFTWVGLKNFQDVFWQNSLMSNTFFRILGWTLIWAFFATFTNFIFGMILAIMINKKGIRFKKFWRTVFVTTVAVPQFVTLMLMSRMLHELGPVNVLLQNLGFISSPIKFLTDGNIARITVILVNIWVGVPYTMLITTGILMNIPEDLYESARIDGANAFVMFTKITLPYMLFVMTPSLITQFIGNINNFNVIFLLTGNLFSLDYFQSGKVDLLITWLYRLTVTEQNYSLASTIGILVFVLCATFSLIFYNKSSSMKREEEFQ